MELKMVFNFITMAKGFRPLAISQKAEFNAS